MTRSFVYCSQCNEEYLDFMLNEQGVCESCDPSYKLAKAVEALKAAPEHICQGVWHTDACDEYRKLRSEVLNDPS